MVDETRLTFLLGKVAERGIEAELRLPLLVAAEQWLADSGGWGATVTSDDPLDKWADVLDDIVYSMRRAGWTVTPPPAAGSFDFIKHELSAGEELDNDDR